MNTTAKTFLQQKTVNLLSTIRQTVSDKSLRLYKKFTDISLDPEKHFTEKPIKNKKTENCPKWADNRKNMLKTLLENKGSEGSPIPVEAGIMGLLAIKKGDEVLELGCGDGFEAKNFFSSKAFHLTAVDSDPSAIRHAVKNNQAKNITYKLCDITRDMTVGNFDSIIWNRGPELFSRPVCESIISGIKLRLNGHGILAGSTVISPTNAWLGSPSDIETIISRYFGHVKLMESSWSPETFYFFASEKEIDLI